MASPYRLFILGRPTFDVDYAKERVEAALAALHEAGVRHDGGGEILFDNDAVTREMEAAGDARHGGVIVLQSTFTDAEAISLIAGRLDCPIHIWAFPEPRTGGRLRLNSFCGLNLAAHALGLRNKACVPLYADPGEAGIGGRIAAWLATRDVSAPALRSPRSGPSDAGEKGVTALREARIGRIGAHPAGFDTCAYDAGKLTALSGATVEPIDLSDLFETASTVPEEEVISLRANLSDVTGLDAVDQQELDRSLRLKSALDRLKARGRYSGFAIRCWPETFTEYGGAVCGPVAMMGEKRTPCACEADVYGALTSLMLQEIAEAPSFLADIVDMDEASDTTVAWHCGQAPASMAEPAEPISATVHSNRRMPLLFQFALRPGRVTLARISQARGETSLVVATGEVVAAPPSFSGTSGVIRFDVPTRHVRDRLLAAGVEHHLALVYGDHAPALEHVASRLGLPVLDLVQ